MQTHNGLARADTTHDACAEVPEPSPETLQVWRVLEGSADFRERKRWLKILASKLENGDSKELAAWLRGALQAWQAAHALPEE